MSGAPAATGRNAPGDQTVSAEHGTAAMRLAGAEPAGTHRRSTTVRQPGFPPWNRTGDFIPGPPDRRPGSDVRSLSRPGPGDPPTVQPSTTSTELAGETGRTVLRGLNAAAARVRQ